MWRVILACVIVLWLFSSCTKDHASATSCPGCPATVSFNATIIPILVNNCAVSGCHNAISDTAGMDFDSAHAYATALEQGTGNVTPGQPGNSIIYTIVYSGGMPLNRTPLSVCEVQDIYCWIEQGAQNN